MSEEKILNIIDSWKNGDYVLAYSFNYYRAGKQNELLLKYITNLQQENKQLKELCDKYEEEHKTTFETWLKGQKVLNELQEWLKEEQERYRDYLSTRPENDSEYNSKYATQCGLAQVDVILDKIQELRNKYGE